jgi:7-cyano-7-deazaguanine synthase
MPKPAVVLLSGGLDSATCLALARRAGFTPVALTIAYGQRHGVEVQQARVVARAAGVSDHRVLSLDLRAIGGSALTSDLAVPKHDDVSQLGPGIPVTYVPARNTIFLGLALGLAEVVGATDLYIGVNAVDYSGYPDCRPEFIRAFEQLANLATRAGVEGARFTVHAPLSGLGKADIVRAGTAAGVDFSLTHSCYDPAPDGAACGRCDSCLIRRKGFLEAGVADPTRYA